MIARVVLSVDQVYNRPVYELRARRADYQRAHEGGAQREGRADAGADLDLVHPHEQHAQRHAQTRPEQGYHHRQHRAVQGRLCGWGNKVRWV